MGGLELIYDFFEDHVRAAGHVNEGRPLALGVLSFLIGGLSLFVAHALSQGLVLLSFSWSSLALTLLFKVCAGFLMAALLHLILEIAGAKGSAASLFVLLGMASLVWALSVPMVLISRLVFNGSALATGTIFVIIGLLSLSLKARSLQDNYQVGPGKAWVALLLPYLAVAVAGVLMFALAVAGLVFQIVKAFQ
jgi:hypothetical protein